MARLRVVLPRRSYAFLAVRRTLVEDPSPLHDPACFVVQRVRQNIGADGNYQSQDQLINIPISNVSHFAEETVTVKGGNKRSNRDIRKDGEFVNDSTTDAEKDDADYITYKVNKPKRVMFQPVRIASADGKYKIKQVLPGVPVFQPLL